MDVNWNNPSQTSSRWYNNSHEHSTKGNNS